MHAFTAIRVRPSRLRALSAGIDPRATTLSRDVRGMIRIVETANGAKMCVAEGAAMFKCL